MARESIVALRSSQKATIAAIADPSERVRLTLGASVPEAEMLNSLEKLLELELDGIVIATSIPFRAFQSIVALGQGLAVFSPLPLGKSTRDAVNVVEAAERADRLLGVDRCHRWSDALRSARAAVESGELGDLYAAVIELGGADRAQFGLPLIDALEWMLGSPKIERARPGDHDSEIRIDFEGGVAAQIGAAPKHDASIIRVELYGTGGTRTFESAPEPSGGRALIDWIEKLSVSPRFDPIEAEGLALNALIAEAIHQGRSSQAPVLAKAAGFC